MRGTAAIKRTLDILELLASSSGERHLSGITRMLGLPKSSTHRMLLTLEDCGYLQRDDRTGRYYFGFKLFCLASTAIARTDLRIQASAMLYKLMQDTALTVHMAIPTGNHALLIEKIDPPQPKRITTYVGCAMEFHSSALGKALLANFTQPVIAAFQKSPQPRYTDNTITMGAELRQQLAEIRRQGYAVDDEEQMVGYRCIGAPVFDLTGSVIAAISVAGTTDQIHGGNIGAISSQVVRCASQISSRLNVPPGSADLSKAQPPIALKPVSSLT